MTEVRTRIGLDVADLVNSNESGEPGTLVGRARLPATEPALEEDFPCA